VRQYAVAWVLIVAQKVVQLQFDSRLSNSDQVSMQREATAVSRAHSDRRL